jgi:biphenyl-2,3-diol 1,2-dioxygenase
VAKAGEQTQSWNSDEAMKAAAVRNPPRVIALGYVGYQACDTTAWDSFLRDIFGLERRADSPKTCHEYRLDDRHHRISVHSGPQDRISYVGWEVASQEALSELEVFLSECEVTVERGSAALAEERVVLELLRFENPDGVSDEVRGTARHRMLS